MYKSHNFISGTCSNSAEATPPQSLLSSVDILSARGKSGVCNRRRSHSTEVGYNGSERETERGTGGGEKSEKNDWKKTSPTGICD